MVGLARNCSSRQQTQETLAKTLAGLQVQCSRTCMAASRHDLQSVVALHHFWLTSVNSWKGAFWKRVSCHNSGDRKP